MTLTRRDALGAFGAFGAAATLAGTAGAKPKAVEPLKVFAAASLTDALKEIGALYAAAKHPEPTFNFAASSTLAKQIEQGAKADLFLSADLDWMDYLDKKGLLAPKTRVNLLANDLVLIAPKEGGVALPAIAPGFDLAGALGANKLALADPDSVPAGKYAKASFESLGVWDKVSPAVVRGENVRAALRYVELGEAAAGVVYRTDALASKKVKIIGYFPADSHAPIIYPMALVKGAAPGAAALHRFLRESQARNVYAKLGFKAPPQ